MPIELGPAVIGFVGLVERIARESHLFRSNGQSGIDENGAEHAVAMQRGDLKGETRTGRATDHHRFWCCGGVEHCNRVGHVFKVVVGGREGWSVGTAVAAPVHRDDPEMAGEIRNLGLPRSRMDH